MELVVNRDLSFIAYILWYYINRIQPSVLSFKEIHEWFKEEGFILYRGEYVKGIEELERKRLLKKKEFISFNQIAFGDLIIEREEGGFKIAGAGEARRF